MKKAGSGRFLDDGKYLHQFADEVLVCCDRCGAPGCGTAEVPGEPWLGPVVVSGRRPCGYCGYQWLYLNKVFHKRLQINAEHFDIQCPECGRTSEVTFDVRQYMPGDRCIDPHFGQSLYLKCEGRLGTLWAYNRDHLAELSGYVAARLRVRTGGGSGAMFSRMPKWLKLAKNRGELEKYLRKLEVLLGAFPGARY